jgi:hypothetical protein
MQFALLDSKIWLAYFQDLFLLISLHQASSTHGPLATDGPQSSLPWPAGHFEKNNYKRDEIKSNFNNARWPLSYTAVF